MRTTIDRPSDLHAAARGIANDRGITLSVAVADLIRGGLGQRGAVVFGRSERTGRPVAWVGYPVTLEGVRSIEDDQ